MFVVYLRESGELLYICDEEAIQHFPTSKYGWVEAPGPDWNTTHIWNSETRSMDAIPTE